MTFRQEPSATNQLNICNWPVQELLGKKDYTIAQYKRLLPAVEERVAALNADDPLQPGAGPSSGGAAAGAQSDEGPSVSHSSKRVWTAELVEMACWSAAHSSGGSNVTEKAKKGTAEDAPAAKRRKR
jgi:hypothetical protein